MELLAAYREHLRTGKVKVYDDALKVEFDILRRKYDCDKHNLYMHADKMPTVSETYKEFQDLTWDQAKPLMNVWRMVYSKKRQEETGNVKKDYRFCTPGGDWYYAGNKLWIVYLNFFDFLE